MADPGEFAAQTRDALDLSLRTPHKRYWAATGDVDEAAPISDRFAVESVTVDHGTVPAVIVVRFRWAGDDDAVYAVAFDAAPSENGDWPVTPSDCAEYMSTNLEEYLVPYGIGAAERIEQGGVIWLSWPYDGFGGRRIRSAPQAD